VTAVTADRSPIVVTGLSADSDFCPGTRPALRRVFAADDHADRDLASPDTIEERSEG
jgi:hypothetical protein